MLSRALRRANDAVALDNTQDYAGAMKAYEEACNCLREVMKHSSNNDDRSKLESIVSWAATQVIGKLADNSSAAHTLAAFKSFSKQMVSGARASLCSNFLAQLDL